MGCPLSRLRQRLGDPTVLGGQEREGQELNASPELGLLVWGVPPLAPSGFVWLPQALLVLIESPANSTGISTEGEMAMFTFLLR